jgi:hypothetical protein
VPTCVKDIRIIKGQMIVLTEEDLKELQERVFKQKMIELFEEPSTYEDDYDDNNGLVDFY